MAGRAVLGRRRMVGDLADGGDAVVAALTVRDQARVIEARRTPGQGGVAVAAACRRDDVMEGLGGGLDAVVTSSAHFLLQQVHVLEPGGHERHGGVAGGAVVVRQNVFGVFARGRYIVVATTAGALCPGVIHTEDGDEVITRVAQGALVTAGDVFERFGSRADTAADGVAPGTVPWGSLEYTVDMAILARHVPVRVPQLESRREVIEPGPLDGRAGGGEEHPQDQEESARQGSKIAAVHGRYA